VLLIEGIFKMSSFFVFLIFCFEELITHFHKSCTKHYWCAHKSNKIMLFIQIYIFILFITVIATMHKMEYSPGSPHLMGSLCLSCLSQILDLYSG